MKKLLLLALILVTFNSIAQNYDFGQIVLKNGVKISGDKIKICKKRIRYQPDCSGCLTPRFIKLTGIDTVIYEIKDNINYEESSEISFIPIIDLEHHTDTIHFLNIKNNKTWCLNSGQKVMFATSSAKYRGFVQQIDGNQIAFSRKRKTSKVDSLAVIESNDIDKFKIKRRIGARIGGTFLKFAGGFAFLAGIGASATLINDVPELIVAVSTGGVGIYYLGDKATTKKIIIGSTWQIVQ